MNQLADFWPGIESAEPDSPAPLLVCADWCDENEQPNLAFALRWCAARGRRPFRRVEVKRHPWEWLREQSRYTGLAKTQVAARAAAVLPRLIFDNLDHNRGHSHTYAYKGSLGAYSELAAALAGIHAALDLPTITVTARPEILRADPITCEGCGVMRARVVELCPVCPPTKGHVA